MNFLAPAEQLCISTPLIKLCECDQKLKNNFCRQKGTVNFALMGEVQVKWASMCHEAHLTSPIWVGNCSPYYESRLIFHLSKEAHFTSPSHECKVNSFQCKKSSLQFLRIWEKLENLVLLKIASDLKCSSFFKCLKLRFFLEFILNEV